MRVEGNGGEIGVLHSGWPDLHEVYVATIRLLVYIDADEWFQVWVVLWMLRPTSGGEGTMAPPR